MKAIYFEEHGDIDQLRFAEIDDPQVPEGYALVRVRAVALNHLDIWVRKGWKGLKLKMPHIGGSDIAGEIVSVNSPNSSWQPGTRVIVNPSINLYEDEWTRKGEDSLSPGYQVIGEQVPGGMAELIAVPVANVFTFPDDWSFSDAAAPILVGTTCWRMLFKRANLCAGESVLIVGAGGGVNSMSIALAKACGAKVIALTSSKEKIDKALEIGASEVINYKSSPNWAIEVLKLTKGRGVDVVVDNVGAATFSQSIRAIARGGRIITVGNTSGHQLNLDNRLIFTKQISILGSTMGSKQDFMDAMQFIWDQNIRPVVDRVEPLENGVRMLQLLESGEQFGKIVLSA